MRQRDGSLTCVEKLHANETREQFYDLRQKQVIRAIGLSKQCTDTYRDSHDATRHKLRRTLAYSFQQYHLPFHLLFFTLDLFSQDSQCDPTEEHHSNICLELHMYHLCACLVNRYSLWFRITKCVQPHWRPDGSLVGIVWRTSGRDETWFAQVQISSQKTTWRTMESTWNDRGSRDEVEFWRGNGHWNIWTNSGTTSRRGNADSYGTDGNSYSTSTCTSARRIHIWNSSSQQQRRRWCGSQDEDGDLWLILRRSYENEGDWQGRPDTQIFLEHLFHTCRTRTANWSRLARSSLHRYYWNARTTPTWWWYRGGIVSLLRTGTLSFVPNQRHLKNSGHRSRNWWWSREEELSIHEYL